MGYPEALGAPPPIHALPPPIRIKWSRYQPQNRYQRFFPHLLFLLAITLLGAASYLSYSFILRPHQRALTSALPTLDNSKNTKSLLDFEEFCPTIEPILPSENSWVLQVSFRRLHSREYFSQSIRTLGAAIRIDTSVNDDFGSLDQDPRWQQKFPPFRHYLQQFFPWAAHRLNVDHINRYGLIYTWEGDNQELKPILLTAHQDVVPVEPETLDEWEHPPYSGHYDGEYIWGRGSLDNKGQLVAIMESVELLLQSNFRPSRTIVLAFGFDEEIGGYHGAQALSYYLTDRYGANGVEMILDEGTSMKEEFGSDFMVVSTAEKGMANIKFTIHAPGGHSASPPNHTSIGIMSKLITDSEENPFSTELSDDNPLLDYLYCAAAHAPGFPDHLKTSLKESDKKKLTADLIEYNNDYLSYFVTTDAATKIYGGLKVNVLPEFVAAEFNYRLRPGSRIEDIRKQAEELASKLAKEHHLGFGVREFGVHHPRYPRNSITLEYGLQRDPSRRSSSRTNITSPYKIIAGTTRAVLGKDLLVAPGLNLGSTDSFWYSNLSENIFRYTPIPALRGKIHDVNERVKVLDHLEVVKWYTAFILNMDEAAIHN